MTSLGVQLLRTYTTSQSNIASSAIDAGAPPSLPLAEMSNFRIQTVKAARQHPNQGSLPTLEPSRTAQANRDIAIEDVHGTQGRLPSPRGRPTESENIQAGGDLSNTTPAEAPSPTRNKHKIRRRTTKQQSEKHKQQPTKTPTENRAAHLIDIIIK